MQKLKTSQTGFTVLELIVVVISMAILVTLILIFRN